MYAKTGVIVALVVIFLGSVSLAKKEKTGVLERNVFTDSLCGYHFTVPYNWKLKTENEPSLLRATLQKTKLEKLPAGGSQGYYDQGRFIPTITIIADTTSLALGRFCELLLGAKGQLPHEDDYLMKLDLLLQSSLEDQQKIKIDSLDGIRYTFQKKQLRVVRDPRQRGLGVAQDVTVEEFLLGHMVVFKNQNKVFMIQCSGERATFQFEDREYQQLFKSWTFKE